MRGAPSPPRPAIARWSLSLHGPRPARHCAIHTQDYDRGSGPYGEYQIANEYIHDNVVVLGPGGDTGLVGSFHAPTSANNRFAGNTYWVDDLAARYFYWGSGRRPLDWGAWKAKQQDTTGLINA